jgi:hypothetical protein
MKVIFRKCRKCGLEAATEEELELFVKKKQGTYGRATICKECAREISKNWRNENKERAKENSKQWYSNNKERVRENYKKWENNNKEVRKERVKRNREALKQYLGGSYKCEHCGFEHSTSAPFDFHHKDPNDKEGSVSALVQNAALDRLFKEVDKCILLCANCHRIEHERLKDEQENSDF